MSVQVVRDVLGQERGRPFFTYPDPVVPPGFQPTTAKARLADQANRDIECQEVRARLPRTTPVRRALIRRHRLGKDTWP